MIYTDTLFVALFVGLWGAAQALRPWPAVREWTVILFSLVVVVSWGELSLLLLLAVAAANFAAVRLAARLDRRARNAVLYAVVTLDLLNLAFFKYAHFIGSILEPLVQFEKALPALGIPLAISFYTFHLISYLIDVSRDQTQPLKLRQYLFYLCFFPHVVAGPIVRTWQLVPQLGKVRVLLSDFPIGLHYFVLGFFLKAIVANNIADAIDPFWTGDPQQPLSVVEHWAVAFLYYCQIYSDFAGYSLMALGMARLLGYRLPPNFRAPILAATMQEFWRRWHITLSRWLRDYLYIPLGGNRRGSRRALINVLVTMVLGGLWHGAAWNFLIWGAMHGAGIAVERMLGMTNRGDGRPRLVWWFVVQIWVTVAWVFFRSPDLGHAGQFLQGMLAPASFGGPVLRDGLRLPLLVALLPILHQVASPWIARIRHERLGAVMGVATGLLLVADLVIYSPRKVFIYFAF